MKVQTSNWWCCRALEWFEEEQNLACGTCLCWYCYLGFTLKICSTLCLPALVPVIAFIQPLSSMKPALRICVRYPRVCKQQKCYLFTIFSYTLTFKGNFLLKPLDHYLSKSTTITCSSHSRPLEPIVYKYSISRLAPSTVSWFALSSY